MPEPGNEKNISDEEIIKKLVRMARTGSQEQFRRPDDAVIGAYLDRNASDIQRKIMERALIASSAFRKEIRDMAADMELIAEKDDSEISENIKKLKVPGQSEFLTAQKRRMQNDQRNDDGFWLKLARVIQLRTTRLVAIPAIAVIAFIIIITVPFFAGKEQSIRWMLSVENVDAPLLISSTPRDVFNRDSIIFHPSAQEAALEAFRNILEFDFDSGELKCRLLSLMSGREMVGTIEVSFVNEKENILASIIDSIPVPASQMGNSLSGWLLTLSDNNLYTIPIASGKISTVWPTDESKHGCFAVVLKDSLGYRFASAIAVEIK